MFKALLNNKIVFTVISALLVLAGSTMQIKLPVIIERILKNDIIKVALLFAILYLGKLAIHYAFIGAILFIILSDKLNDKEIENFSN